MIPRPEILSSPNIPKPLHGVNPRSIMGQDAWNVMRQEVYASTEFSPYRGTPGSRNHYDAIPLCKFECHNFGPLSLHMGRKSWRVRNGPDYKFIQPTREAVEALFP